MSNIRFKKETMELIQVMIEHADQGPSGFWRERDEGCGNPRIFPEFETELKHRGIVSKDHYICPWNTAVLFGDGNGNITTGCYHSCSIKEAKYLPEDMLKKVLIRFKERMQKGEYDQLEHIRPLLTIPEKQCIERRKREAAEQRERSRQKSREEKTRKAAKLLEKYAGDQYICGLLSCYYGEDTIVSAETGTLDFSSDHISDIVSQKPLSYDDYLDLQICSLGKQRDWFELCYYNFPSSFAGRVERKNKAKICFERIFVTGMYQDDCSFFDGKESHVWMDVTGFEELEVGDCVRFYADVYRYVKTGNGKILDYGLRNPKNIEKIESYKLPSDDDLIRQSVRELVCEMCFYNERCNRTWCMRDENEVTALRKELFRKIKANKEERQ